MNEFQATKGLCALDDIDEILEGRKKVYEYYMNNLPNSLTFQKKNEHGTLNYGYLPVVFRDEESLVKVNQKLNNEGIYSRRYFYLSLHGLPYMRKQRNVPNSSYIAKRILCLPIYYSMELNETKKLLQ